MGEIDLKPFCAEHSCRYRITEPFVRDGWRYATDGAIVVRVPCPGEPDSDGTLLPKPECFEWETLEGELKPWPPEVRSDSPDGLLCRACNHTGLVPGKEEKCLPCKGEGFVYCDHCGSETQCDECHGDGYIGQPCNACEGKKVLIKNAVQYVIAFHEKLRWDAVYFRSSCGAEGIVAGLIAEAGV